jgi:hypothetical protein
MWVHLKTFGLFLSSDTISSQLSHSVCFIYKICFSLQYLTFEKMWLLDYSWISFIPYVALVFRTLCISSPFCISKIYSPTPNKKKTRSVQCLQPQDQHIALAILVLISLSRYTNHLSTNVSLPCTLILYLVTVSFTNLVRYNLDFLHAIFFQCMLD